MTTDSRLVHISSAHNPLLAELRRLSQDNGAYRRSGKVWIEGDHLCRAAVERGVRPEWAVFSASGHARAPASWSAAAERVAILDDALFARISGLESPAWMGFVVRLGDLRHPLRLQQNTVVLDRIQDAGNVGSILRTAGAMGFRQVLALKGTAALWSAKVLRAGMGAHFGLQLHEGLDAADVLALEVPLLVTHLQGDRWVHDTLLPSPCAWVMGHEGQGVQPALVERADLLLRIVQPGGEESLNVAAAAAICLHASVAGTGRP